MSSQITTEVKNHVIILNDGSVEYVTEATVLKIAEMHFNELVNLGNESGGLRRSFKKSEIENMMTLESYEKKRNPYPRFEYQQFVGERSPELHKQALGDMIIGLKRYIDGPDYQGTQAPIERMAMMERTYNLI